MARNSETIKGLKPRRRRSKAKVVEWETRVYSRGIRDVPVDVTAMASRPKPRKGAGRQPRAESNDALQGENAPQSMDVDETFWTEEPVTDMPTSEKRVRQPSCPSTTLNEPHTFPISSTPTLKNLLPRLVLTYAASSTPRAFRQRLHVRAASLLRSSGGVPTAFLHLSCARSAAESHIGYFLFTESKNG